MTSFILNTKRLNASIESYKRKRINKINDALDNTYANLINLDSCWNDDDSIKMMEIIKNDKLEIFDYLDELDNLIDVFKRFNNNIVDICLKYEKVLNVATLDFNDVNISYCYTKIMNAISYLENAYDYLSYADNIDNYNCKSTIIQLEASIKNIKNNLTNLLNNIKYFVRDINEEIDNTTYSIKKYDILDLEIQKPEYTYTE